MAGETTITVVGNLTSDPELRFTPNGVAVAKFRIASTPRAFDKASGEFKDGEPLFLSCSVWQQQAENVAESLTRGQRVIVTGRLTMRSYEKDGEKKSITEIQVDEVGPALRYGTAAFIKGSKGGSGGGGAPAQPARQAPARQASPKSAPAADPWGDEPPF